MKLDGNQGPLDFAANDQKQQDVHHFNLQKISEKIHTNHSQIKQNEQAIEQLQLRKAAVSQANGFYSQQPLKNQTSNSNFFQQQNFDSAMAMNELYNKRQ